MIKINKISNGTDLVSTNEKSIFTQSNVALSHNDEVFEIEDDGSQQQTFPEISLFRAVIMQALVDSINKSKRTEDKIAKISANRWFNRKNEDFKTVCRLADLNYNWVIKKFLNSVKNK